MKNNGFYPYLPSWEYIPDGEPYVFNGREHIYGSHDKVNGHVYCHNDYVCRSAPEGDLSDRQLERQWPFHNQSLPEITQEGRDGGEEPGYVANIQDNYGVGFKYFDCKGIKMIKIKTRGYNSGVFHVKTNKIVFLAIVLLLALIMPVFGQPKIPKAPANVVKTIKAMGGVTIGNWWSDYDVNTVVPKSDYDERLLDYRKRLLKENDIVIRDKNIASWNEMQQLTAISIMTGKPAAQVFVLQPNWALSLYQQNLLYPVSDNRQVNLKSSSPIEWNKTVNDSFTFNKKIYAFAAGYGNSLHAEVLVWNKRLFREAGLDENLPYDLQKSGKWTWDEFLNICKKLTRDTNNDGKIDIYAMPRDLSTEILDALVSSNGATYVGKNQNTGKLFNATDKPEFIEAVQFFLKLRDEKVLMPRPEGSEWNWHIPAFNDGKAAMRIDAQYIVNGDLQSMKDDWGMVLPPKGKRAKNYTVFTDENVMVVPNTFNRDQVDAIMWAVQAWNTPIDNNWRASLYNIYRDRRAIDETWELIRNPALQSWKYYLHVPGLERGGIAWEIWYHDGEASQLIEAVSQQWNALIKDANE